MERITYQEIPAGMFEKLLSVEGFINESSLGMQLLEIIRLRVAQLNSCAYCVDMHHKELAHLGETGLRISLLPVWQEAPCFSEKERAALAFAEALTRLAGAPVPDQVYDPLLLYFNKEEVCFLTLAVCQINTWNRLMLAFRFPAGNYQLKEQKAEGQEA